MLRRRLLAAVLALALSAGPAFALEEDANRDGRITPRDKLLVRILERDHWGHGPRVVRLSLIAGKHIAEKRFGWTAENGQWPALRALWSHESGWRWGALNPSSGACGIPQFLPCRKGGPGFMSLGPINQIRRGCFFIQRGYGTPLAACRGDCSSGAY